MSFPVACINIFYPFNCFYFVFSYVVIIPDPFRDAIFSSGLGGVANCSS
jgi:hypothetical protein